MMRMPHHPQPTPTWPYPDIVRMSAHRPSGQWRKRHAGRDYYFGRLSDPDGALAAWRARWPEITGQHVPPGGSRGRATPGERDRAAVQMVMGHVTTSVHDRYSQAIADHRLLSVTSRLHDWLFGCAESELVSDWLTAPSVQA